MMRLYAFCRDYHVDLVFPSLAVVDKHEPASLEGSYCFAEHQYS
jgi:hypothetical protein